MKKEILPLLLLVAAGLLTAETIQAQGTAFTYQGRLNTVGVAANGNYDLTFTVYDSITNESGIIGVPLTNSAVAVSNGLFTVTLDFGGGVFDGSARWLEIGVRTNGVGTFTTLSPRQAILPTPYAIAAGNLIGALPAAQLSGVYTNGVTFNNPGNSFAGNGSGLTNLNSANLSAGTAAINISGNATTATTANNFSGSLIGDVTGTQGATVVSSVGGQTAANVASGAVAANAATSANTASTIVARDASGNFSASTITATNFTGNGSALTNLQATNLVGSLPQYPTVQIATNAPFTNAILMSPDGTNRVWSAGTNLFDVAGAGTVAMNSFGNTIPVSMTNTANLFTGDGGGLTNVAGLTATTATNLPASSYYEVCTNGWRDLNGVWHPVSTTNSPGDSLWAAWTSSWTNLPSAGGEFRLSPGIFYRPEGWPVPNTTACFQCYIIGSAYPNTQLSGDSNVFYNVGFARDNALSDITVEHVAFTFQNWSAKTVAVNMQGYSHSRLSDFLICWAGQMQGGIYEEGYQQLPSSPPGMLGLIIDGSDGYQVVENGFITGCAVDLCSVAEHCAVNDMELHCASRDGDGDDGNLWTANDSTTFPSFVAYPPTSLEMSSGAALVDHRMTGDEVFNHIHIFQSMSGIYFAGGSASVPIYTGEYGVNYYDNIMFEDTAYPIVYDPGCINTPIIAVNFNYYYGAPVTNYNYSSSGVFTQTTNHQYTVGYEFAGVAQTLVDVLHANLATNLATNTANQFTGTFTNGSYYGNGRGLTNILATAMRATNSPVNGYALRYTNGTFYWAP